MQITINRKTGVLALATAGILATVGVGWAAIPGDDGQIKGCYATTSGLRSRAAGRGRRGRRSMPARGSRLRRSQGRQRRRRHQDEQRIAHAAAR